MTNLLIGYHDIETAAYQITSNETFNTLFPLWHLKGGFRNSCAISTALTTEPFEVTFSLTDDDTRAAEYLYIPAFAKDDDSGWCDILRLKHSPDDSTYTTALEATSVNTEADIGKHRNDFFETFTKTDAKQYWKLSFASVVLGRKATINAPFIGCFFDFGAEASSWSVSQEKGQRTLSADSGATFMGQGLPVQRDIDVTWAGVTETKLAEFETKIASTKAFNSFLLYASGSEFVLDMETIVHCRLESVTITKSTNPDWRNVMCKFIEEAI